ncbi:Hypothetical predicted protein [Cloeon dipterum]|uniref:Mab-21-like nucleotidyltransferase domain-containing protein n=1 Tax=Cloeon dipterum TaxID=197152 RepID=A0A8S1CQH9_9INSE|nr:Hypothetical predicted protein [Cloeon dipterum]
MVKNKSPKNDKIQKASAEDSQRRKVQETADKSGVSDLCKRLSAVSVNFRKEGKTVSKHPPCIPRKAFPPECSLTVMQDDSVSVIPHLQDVLSDIRIDLDRKRENRQLINDLVKNTLINALKNRCEIFKYLFREVAFVGSFYEGLKITDADEFDLNIVLKLPFGATTPYEVGEIKRAPGHMFLKWEPAHLDRIKKSMEPKLKPIFNWVDEDGYLLVSKVHRYWESLMAKYMADIDNELRQEVNDLGWSKNGPAITLYFDDVAVDLVPAFAFPWNEIPPPYVKNPQIILPDHKNLRWFVVPKPLKEKGLEKAWRLSFSEHEREMIHDFGWLKPAIKIVKVRKNYFEISIFMFVKFPTAPERQTELESPR